MILTIAIPTYNRPEKVRNTILQLLPQLNDQVFLKVLDNHSDVDIKNFVHNDITSAVANKVEIIRHRVNIGADANFARCFELCSTPYLWMLGDDDKVEENAVEIILAELHKYKDKDLIGINFKSNLIIRQAPIIISSIKDLSEKLDDFGNWSFISTSVYKTEAFLKYLQYSAWGTYSMSSQLIPTMKAISTGKVFVLSEKYLVTNVPEADLNVAWSDFQFALGLSAILEAPVGFKNNEYKLFGNKLSIHFNCIYPGDVLFTILKSVKYNIDKIDNYHIYIYKRMIIKTLEFRDSRKFRQLTQYYICLFLLKNKGALKILFSLIPAIKQKSEKKVPFNLFRR